LAQDHRVASTTASPHECVIQESTKPSTSNGVSEVNETRKKQAVSAPKITSPLHVHFGAGKLGLGLVVPALENSSTSYVILQRPSKDWEGLLSSNSAFIPVKVNGEDVLGKGLKLITQRDIDEAVSKGQSVMQLVAESPSGQGHLVLSDDPQVSSELASGASSFSCALGGAISSVLASTLQQLPKRHMGARPVLYACENDLDSVQQLADQLKRRVEVVPCMVDRICSNRRIEGGGDPAIYVDAEEHSGSIVLLEQSSQSYDDLPLDGETVQVPDSDEVADYLFVQKKRLVNSMHTVLAFSTLVDFDMNRASLFDWDRALPELPLLNYAEASPDVKESVWAWAVAQILVLMKEKGVDVMTQAHNAESDEELVEQMLAVARQTLERFSSIEDTTSRVLGGGVSNRYHTRLVPVQEGVHIVEAMLSDLPSDCIHRKVLAAAGVDMPTVVRACDQLVEEARKFADLDEEERAAQEQWRELTLGLHNNFMRVVSEIPKLVARSPVSSAAGLLGIFDQVSKSN